MVRVDREWLVQLAGLFAFVGLFAWFVLACAASAPALYGAERLACVQQNDAAGPARECMRKVDQGYGQDGGLK